jgi:hypothetical protein
LSATLSQSEVTKYGDDGYLILDRPILPDDSFERLQALCDESLAAASGEVSPALLDCPHCKDPRYFEWLLSDAFLDIMEPLIGPDIAIFACHILQKPPGAGKRVPWHEDSGYWQTALQPMEVASLTIALEPCTSENGCMRVIPGSHRHGYSDYEAVDSPEDNVFDFEIKPDQVDESKAVDQVLMPNQAAIHNARIIHSSEPNTGNVRRRVFTVRYFPATSRFNPDAHEHFKKGFYIYLARGEDRADNTYSDPTVAQALVSAKVYT